MTDPRVSVLLVTCDHEGFIESALASIENQVFDDAIEVVVADDSSTDRTLPLIATWAERVDIEVRILPGEARLGAAANHHRGFAACRGRYIAVLEGDDEWLSVDKLRLQAQVLDRHPELSMAVTHTLVEDGATGSSRTVPDNDGTSTQPPATSGQPADANWVTTPSAAMYRAEMLERLNPEIFETAAYGALMNLAMTGYGDVGLLPDVAALHRVRHDGPRSHHGERQDDVRPLLPEHGHLVGPGVVRELSGDTGVPEIPVSDRADRSDPASGKRRGIVVLDDHFPTKSTGFRIAEFDWMMRHGVVAEVMTTVRPLEPLLAEYATLYPQTHRQISAYDARRLAEFECASVMFLNNAAHFLADLERHRLPFVLTLYPGGGLHLGEAAAERKLRRVLASPQLRHVITTQPLVTDLVTTMSGGSVPVTEVLGGAVSRSYLRPGPGLRTNYFGTGKPFLDVCFVAQRYTADGSDKGWPVFLESLRMLRNADLPVRGHVVGGFGPADVGGEYADLELSFSGVLSQPELREFYMGMDVIVSPTKPGRLAPGSFDGFPTGTCVEAAFCGVAVVATDPLEQNRIFTDGRDIHMPRASADEVTRRILALLAEEDGLRGVAQEGLRTVRRAYGVDAQLWPRRRVLEATRTAGRDRRDHETATSGDPLVSILIPTYNGERFLRPTLRSALTQSYRNIEVLIGDDGSTDGTRAILADVAASDPRVRLILHERNIGTLENKRQLVAEARGEFVKFLMHDDVLATDCVRELVRGLEQHLQATMAFSHRVSIDENGRPTPGHEFPKLLDRPGVIDGRALGANVLMTCTNMIGEPTTVLFRRADVAPEELWLVDGRSVDVLNDVQLWLLLLRKGSAFYTPRTLSRFRQHPGQNSFNPRWVGRAERDWSRLVDWGARNGFLTDPGQTRRAQARALLLAVARIAQMIDSPHYGASLEAAFLSIAGLVELAAPALGGDSRDLAVRAHDAPVLGRFAQELDVWTREYPFALAAPAVEPAEIAATVQSLRDVVAAGATKRAVIAVPPAALDQAVPLIEDALAQGTDIDVELVPSEDPATLLPEPWLAVVPHGGTWHDARSQAVWRFDPAAFVPSSPA